jgi:hypothetical protein
VTKGHCPVCFREGRASLREITPSGIKQQEGYSAQWWLVTMHSDGKGGVCPGSGAKV